MSKTLDRWAAMVLCGMVLRDAARRAAASVVESGRGVVDLGHGLRLDVDDRVVLLHGPADAVDAIVQGVLS